MLEGEKVIHFFKRLLILGLVFQLTFGVSLSYLYAGDEDKDPSEKILAETYKEAPWPLSILADELPATAQSPEVQREIREIESGLQAIEEGRTSDLPKEKRDVFHLGGQRFEILKNGQIIQTFDLGQLNIELPYIAYDSLRVVIEGEDLVIEAINVGDVVARHVIPNMHALATALDRELLYIFDHEGRLHATDMAFNRTQALFRAPIPFFKNLWTPLKPLNLDGEIKLTFLTRGLKPFDEMDPSHPQHHQVVLPKEHIQGKDELIYSAGDLVVYKEAKDGTDSERHLLGIFSRGVTHAQIARAKIILGWLGIIANPSEIPQSTLQEIIKLIEAEEAEGDLTAVQDALTPVARRALSAFSGNAIQAFLNRAKKNAALEGRVVDQMTLESWAKSFETLRSRAQALIEIKDGSEKEAQHLKAELEANDLGESWQKLSNPSIVVEEEKTAQGGFFHRLSRFMPKPKTLKILGGIAAGGTLVAGGYAADVAPIVHTLNYVWANWVPSVLHDAEYRWPLTLSVVSLLAFIPLCNFVGIASVPVMAHLSKLIGKLPGQRARKISLWLEERANTWRPMSTWQRNVSIGMRFYGRLILPAFHWIGNTICRQPNFLAALRAKMNPLSSGALGAIGINSPLASRQTLREKRQVLSDLAFHHNRANTMARNLALLVVSEKTNVDPATILAVLSGDIAPEDVESILKDSKKQQEWDLVTEALSHSLEHLTSEEAQALLEKADPNVLAETYEEAQRVAAEVRSRGHVTQALMQLKKRFFDISKRALSRLANFGVEDYELLSRGYAAPAIANQVKMEFVSDHIVVVGYPSFWGPRADLSDPKNLAADSNGGSVWNLWTNPGHLYDLVMNTYAHFFASGSRQMAVYYKKPEVV